MTAGSACTAVDVATSIAKGELNAEQIVASSLARIKEREPEVQAWCHVDPEQALAAARHCDVDSDGVGMPEKGRLRGIPVGIKDMFDTADMPTAYGSPIYADHCPRADAAVVALIRRAGGIPLGKTVTTEFALFEPGRTRNPRDPARTPGGSSSGSAAAVADGMVPLALGTQTAGSIIRPASFCGVVGYKPSRDLISPAGMKDVAWSLDTVGVFARNVVDASLFAEVLSGRELALGETDRAPRFGICRTPQWPSADADARNALAQAADTVANNGGVSETRELPPDFDRLLEAHRTVMAYEASQTLMFEFRFKPRQISGNLADLLTEGLEITARAYDAALAHTRACVAQLDKVFDGLDGLITPSAPGEAPMGSEGTGNPVFNSIWTLLGLPCVNVPGLKGLSELPVGVQVIGRAHADNDTLVWAHWLMNRLDRISTVY